MKDLVSSGATKGIKPKVLKDSRDIFDNISLKAFRDTLNRLKREQRFLPSGSGKEIADSSGHQSARDSDGDEEKDDDEHVDIAEETLIPKKAPESFCTLKEYERVVRPDYIIAAWKEKTTKRQYVSVAVTLPSESEKLRVTFEPL